MPKRRHLSCCAHTITLRFFYPAAPPLLFPLSFALILRETNCEPSGWHHVSCPRKRKEERERETHPSRCKSPMVRWSILVSSNSRAQNVVDNFSRWPFRSVILHLGNYFHHFPEFRPAAACSNYQSYMLHHSIFFYVYIFDKNITIYCLFINNYTNDFDIFLC